MTLVINSMPRTFSFQHGGQTITLDDPDPSQSPDEVMNFFSNIYPELTTASVHGPQIEDDTARYEFKTTIGTKG